MILSEAGVKAAFRKKYGIPPKGAGPHAASSYGLPLPPASHPAAIPFARAVIRRAGQATNFDPDDVRKQVRKAKDILRGKRREAIGNLAALTFARSMSGNVPKTPPPKPKMLEGAKTHPLVVTEHAFTFREDAGAEGNVQKGVLLIRSGTGNRADRNYYTDAALEKARMDEIFEGARSFLDHPTPNEEEQQPGRSVRALAGWYSNVTTAPYTDPETGDSCVGLFADFYPQLGRDDVIGMIRTCAEYAKRYPRKSYVGLSISAHGIGQPDEIGGEQWNRIDQITGVESVDIVTRAGAGGSFTPLRESYMSATAKTKPKDGIAVTLDRAKLEEGAKALRESLKASQVALIESITGAKVTPEQDAAIDKNLGVVDGGKIDQLLDAATGVDPDDTDDADEMTEDDDMAEGGSPQPDAADPFRKNFKDATEADWNAGKAAMAAMKKKSAAAMKEAADAKKDAEGARKLAESAASATRERDVDAVLAEINPPESFRPRLRRELLESSAKTRDEFKERATEFDAAYIRPLMERGVVAVAHGGGTAKMTFDYGKAV
jgi:hypothetical protein